MLLLLYELVKVFSSLVLVWTVLIWTFRLSGFKNGNIDAVLSMPEGGAEPAERPGGVFDRNS